MSGQGHRRRQRRAPPMLALVTELLVDHPEAAALRQPDPQRQILGEYIFRRIAPRSQYRRAAEHGGRMTERIAMGKCIIEPGVIDGRGELTDYMTGLIDNTQKARYK